MRLRFPEALDKRHPAYHFESLDFVAENRKLNAYYAEFEAVERANAHKHQHDGVEFLYVISGKLAMQVGDDESELTQGRCGLFRLDGSALVSQNRITPDRRAGRGD